MPQLYSPPPLAKDLAELDRLIREMPVEARPVAATEPIPLREPPPITFSSEKQQQYLYRIINEYTLRMQEALTIYRPLPVASDFHESRALRRIVIGSNRAGKTLLCAAEVARIVTGQDPHHKLPDSNGTFLAVGEDEDHIGQVMWKKLAMPGAFYMIPDEETGAWRAVRPDPANPRQIDPIDEARRGLWRPAPPLLSPRHYDFKEVSWFKKKLNQPKQVPLKSGWELRFRSGKGSPDQGTADRGAWFDEEIKNEGWYSETAARLVDQMGSLIWSATAQSATDQLLAIYDACEKGEPNFQLFRVLIDENPYLDAAAKAQFYADCAAIGPDEVAVRYYGQLAAHGLRVYPEFQPLTVHCCDAFPVPKTWTRYMIVDPGFQVCALLFLAVPPDEDVIYVYAERYLRGCTPDKFGDAVQELQDGVLFEAFIIDERGGSPRHANTGRSISEDYAQALAERNIRSRRSGFIEGSSDVDGRTAMLKRWLKVNEETGLPKLQIFRGCCQELEREMKGERYRPNSADKRKAVKGHTVDCLEYAAAANLYYRRPELTPDAQYIVHPHQGQFEVLINRTGAVMERFDRLEDASKYANELNDTHRAAGLSLKQKRASIREHKKHRSAIERAYAKFH